MEHLFNGRRLESSLDNPKKRNQIIILKMHKIFRNLTVVCFILLALFSFSYAQKTDQTGKKGDITGNLRANYDRHVNNQEDRIPIGTRNEFASDFSNVQDVTWKVGPGYSEAEFVKDGKSMMAFFDYDDEWIGTGYYVDYADLPEKGRERIAKDYGDYIPEKAMFYEDEQNDEDLLNFFGNFLQSEAYFVLLRKDNEDKEIVVQVALDGEVSYFSNVHHVK
jgi:hypothetical protein